MSRKLYISAVGMLTPLGLDLPMTVASVRAGINVYADSNCLDDTGQAIKMALVPHAALPAIRSDISFHGRYNHWHKHLLRLAHPTIAQAMHGYQGHHAIPIILNMPESQVMAEVGIPSDFVKQLAEQSQCHLSLQHQRLLTSGRAGVIEALALAEKLLYERDFDEVLIGGVDSYQLPSRLRALEREQRLAGPGNMDGFTPGEAAAFLRLSRHREHSCYGDAHLSGAQIASEAGHLYSDGEYLGDGLAVAVTECCQYSTMALADKVLVSANGERYWAKELGTAMIRNHDLLAEDITVEHPAEFYGDLGAAAAAVLIGLAAEAWVPGRAQLICASSDFALRGVVQFGDAVAQQQLNLDDKDQPLHTDINA